MLWARPFAWAFALVGVELGALFAAAHHAGLV